MSRLEYWKNKFPTFWLFATRYHEDFDDDYPDEKDYWEEFFIHNYTIIKVDNIKIVNTLILEITEILKLNHEDFDDFIHNMHDDHIGAYFPEKSGYINWLTSISHYMQKRLG